MANFKIALAVHGVGGLQGPAKSVLLHLSLYTSIANGGRIYASHALLVHTTGYCERTLRTTLAHLQREGWITVEGERKSRIKGYAIVLEKLGLTLEDVQPKRKAAATPEHSAQAAHVAQFAEGEEYPDYEHGLAAAASPRERRADRRQKRWQTEEQRQRMEKAFRLE